MKDAVRRGRLGNTATAGRRWTVGRLQVGFHRWIHTYPAGDKRYVFEPFLIWDYGKQS